MGGVLVNMTQVEPLFHRCTPAAFEDQFLYLLSSKTECDVILEEDGHWYIHPFFPYLNQAEGLLYTINIYDPILEFVIWQSDIPDGLVSALMRLGRVAMKKVITNAVRRLFESVDPEYYHRNGIHGKIKWTFGRNSK